MNHAPFIIACYSITIMVLLGLSLEAFMRLKRDKKLLEQLPSSKK